MTPDHEYMTERCLRSRRIKRPTKRQYADAAITIVHVAEIMQCTIGDLAATWRKNGAA
jgi:hypothetical protein